MTRAPLLLALALGACARTPPPKPSGVFLVRHAEKATDNPKDPSLSEIGQQRAEDLAVFLVNAGVTHLFATEFRRTRDTLAPLAKRLGLEVTIMSSKDAEAQLRAIRSLPAGSVAVIAGHSNTIPGLARALGGDIARVKDTPEGPQLEDTDYNRVFLVITGGPTVAGFELRYGAPSPPPAPPS